MLSTSPCSHKDSDTPLTRVLYIYIKLTYLLTLLTYFRKNHINKISEEYIMILPIEPESPWETFFYAIKWKLTNDINYQFLKEKLTHHIGDKKWILGRETSKDGTHQSTDGEHVHVLAQMTKKQYESLNKNIKDKFKLNGVARDGSPKQYGKVKQIRSIDRMAAYVIKDGNYETNLEPEIIEELKKLLLQIQEEKEKTPKGEENKNTKKATSWVRETANYIIEKYPDKTWDVTDPRDYPTFEKCIFDKLGNSAKAFDAIIFERLFWGVYHLVPKTRVAESSFKNTIAARVRQHLLPQHDINSHINIAPL